MGRRKIEPFSATSGNNGQNNWVLSLSKYSGVSHKRNHFLSLRSKPIKYQGSVPVFYLKNCAHDLSFRYCCPVKQPPSTRGGCVAGSFGARTHEVLNF